MAKAIANCEVCGREFSNYPSRIGRFCSKSCSARWQHRNLDNKKTRRGQERPCEACGQALYGGGRKIEAGEARFCSKACQSRWQARNQVVKPCAFCGAEMALSPSQGAIQYCSKRCEGEGRIIRPLERMHNGRRAKLADT